MMDTDFSIIIPQLAYSVLPIAMGPHKEEPYKHNWEILKDLGMIFFAPVALSIIGPLLTLAGICKISYNMIPMALNRKNDMITSLVVLCMALTALIMIVFSPISRIKHLENRLSLDC